ncbi:hypothetical protein B296_00026788 [Ensete ventricosum]|uniref:Uncharacterized protein n=1 Tax=Ensete ventricosum TaxID=4639 RepID=A0A426ZSX9_ENSVE|nr:hypothetical protein B296_00026788 [Ensete ventricosum]
MRRCLYCKRYRLRMVGDCPSRREPPLPTGGLLAVVDPIGSLAMSIAPTGGLRSPSPRFIIKGGEEAQENRRGYHYKL